MELGHTSPCARTFAPHTSALETTDGSGGTRAGEVPEPRRRGAQEERKEAGSGPGCPGAEGVCNKRLVHRLSRKQDFGLF